MKRSIRALKSAPPQVLQKSVRNEVILTPLCADWAPLQNYETKPSFLCCCTVPYCFLLCSPSFPINLFLFLVSYWSGASLVARMLRFIIYAALKQSRVNYETRHRVSDGDFIRDIQNLMCSSMQRVVILKCRFTHVSQFSYMFFLKCRRDVHSWTQVCNRCSFLNGKLHMSHVKHALQIRCRVS